MVRQARVIAVIVGLSGCSSAFPKTAQSPPRGAQHASVGSGAWGGQHIALEVTATGARVEFDCAHGTIDEPLMLDIEGAFNLKGTFTSETGGPVRAGRPADSRPARFVGRLSGSTLAIEAAFVVPGGTEPIGAFALTRAQPRITKCQ